MHFESTLPLDAPDLMRASSFRRHALDGLPAPHSPTLMATLNPSLLQDLARFEHQRQPGEGPELLEVMGACVRHGRSLLVQLQNQDSVIPLTLFPLQRLAHCPLPMARFLECPLAELQVLQVEPAVLRPIGDAESALVGAAALHAPLGALLWELALRGAREELLPQIAGQAAYRIAPGVDLRGLHLSGSMAEAVRRLKRHTTHLREIAEWPGFDRARAVRMLNGLYLQAGLMVSRAHPAATNEGWFSGGR